MNTFKPRLFCPSILFHLSSRLPPKTSTNLERVKWKVKKLKKKEKWGRRRKGLGTFHEESFPMSRLIRIHKRTRNTRSQILNLTLEINQQLK